MQVGEKHNELAHTVENDILSDCLANCSCIFLIIGSFI